MKLKKFVKVISVIAAPVALEAAAYVAIKKLTAKKEPEYFDDNDFFECDNDIEIVDVAAEDAKAEEEAPKAEPKKAAPKKKAAKKKADAE